MRIITSLLLAFALFASACGGGSGTEVASVGDTVITDKQLGAMFASEDFIDVDDEATRSALFSLIAKEVLMQGLQSEFGVGLDVAEVDAFHADLVAEMEAAGETPAGFLGIDNAGEAMLRFNAELAIIRRTVIERLIADPGFVDLILADTALITAVCVRHVLVSTEEEAVAVIERLGAGEDLGAIANEVSLDTATADGDLGCSSASRYVDEFAQASLDAPLGEVFGPVQTDFGFHVLVVSERSAPSREEIAADPANFVPNSDANTLWGEWINDNLQAAAVTVDERYGFWSPVGIVPPDRPDLVPPEE